MSNGETNSRKDPWAHLVTGDLEEIQIYVEDIVDLAELDLDVELERERDALVVNLVGPDADMLLDYGGETLDAFQILLGKIIPRKFGTTLRILMDSNGYRIAHERELIEIAMRAAKKVSESGQLEELSPMNSMERRIVHLALADVAGITTTSTGEGDGTAGGDDTAAGEPHETSAAMKTPTGRARDTLRISSLASGGIARVRATILGLAVAAGGIACGGLGQGSLTASGATPQLAA